jgi:hypothetical protein
MISIELVCFHHALLGRSVAAGLPYLLAQQRFSCGMRAPEPVVVLTYRAPHPPWRRS